MLPDPDHGPSGCGQARVGVTVANPVRLDLLAPPSGVRLRPSAVLRTAVPVAAVAEDRDLATGEDDVRSSA